MMSNLGKSVLDLAWAEVFIFNVRVSSELFGVALKNKIISEYRSCIKQGLANIKITIFSFRDPGFSVMLHVNGGVFLHFSA